MVLNQSLFLSLIGFIATLVLGFALMGAYLRAMAADAATAEAGRRYLLAFVPALAMQFALITLGCGSAGGLWTWCTRDAIHFPARDCGCIRSIVGGRTKCRRRQGIARP